jgi:hypothetical protein
MNELGLEDEFVSDRLGTTHRAIDVFRTGEFQGTHNERLRIVELLEEHKQTTKTVSGFLGVCSCGEGIDDYNEHLQELIKGEQK